MPTVRVTCPECEHPFNIPDTRVGGLVTCRDCQAEFRVEFAEDDAPPPAATPDPDPEPDDRPDPRPKPTRSRVDVDHEPDEWKTDLPLRSPVPLLLILLGLQAIAAVFLVVNWFFPVTAGGGPPTTGANYSSYPTYTPPRPTAVRPTDKW